MNLQAKKMTYRIGLIRVMTLDDPEAQVEALPVVRKSLSSLAELLPSFGRDKPKPTPDDASNKRKPTLLQRLNPFDRPKPAEPDGKGE